MLRPSDTTTGDAAPDAALQTYGGTTIEEALTRAAEALGAGLQVADALLVRSGGVGGFFAKQHYEVRARPGRRRAGTVAGSVSGPRFEAADDQHLADQLDMALRCLVDDVEAREITDADSDIDGIDLTASSQRLLGRFTDDDLVDLDAGLLDDIPGLRHLATTASTGGAGGVTIDTGISVVDDDPADLPALLPQARSSTAPDPAEPAPIEIHAVDDDGADDIPLAAQSPAPAHLRRDSGTGATDRGPAPPTASAHRAPTWSREALDELGVPAAIVAAIPDDLAGDGAWTAALERAISTLVGPPADAPSDADPLVVSAHGTERAPDLLRAAAAGLAVGTLTIGGEAVPATPGVLARALRTCVRP